MRRDKLNLSDPPNYDRPGDTWMCGSSDHACANGPSRSGKCPLADACHPKRTWYGRRRAVVFGTLAVGVFLLAFSVRPSVAPYVFKPGELSTPHSQILAGQLTSDRCASCHESASLSPLAWFNADNEGHRDVSQTDRCLDCHHRTIDRDSAKMAHNLPRQVRDDIRARIRLASTKSGHSWRDALPAPSVNQENVDCAACHREHRGTDGNLLDVSDTQCQTCHEERFGNFATSHPEWEQWPYGRGGEIAFNHQSHMTKHFPSTMSNGKASEFRCNDCHTVNQNNEISRSVSYEVGCKSCHDDAIKMESSKGFDLVALPTIPEDAATSAGSWPESATGFTDGKVSPIAELLIRADQRSAELARSIPNRDLSRLPDSPESVELATSIAIAHRNLMLELAENGQPEFTLRARKVGVSPSAMEGLIRTLPPQLIGDAIDKWFASQTSGNPSASIPRPESGSVRLVDYTESLSPKRGSGKSILLPLESEEDILFGVPRVAQRPDRPRRVTNTPALDFADDSTLLGRGPLLKLEGTISDTQKQDTSPYSNANKSDVGNGARGRISDQATELILPPANDKQQNTGDLLVDDSLVGEPGEDDLLMEAPLAESPSSQDPLNNDPLAEGSSQNDALVDDPLSEDPLMEDPLAEDPLAEDPLAGDPLMEDPLAGDPLAEDPLTEDPLMEDPLTSDPLSEDPLAGDPLAEAPKPRSKSKRFDPAALLPSGGWYRDDMRLAISYRGGGHSDPVLRSAIELVRQLPANDPVRLRLLSNQAIASCASCHIGATNQAATWTGRNLVGRKSEFTKFAHGPHMNIAGLSDCKHCHQINISGQTVPDDPISLASYVKTDGNSSDGSAHASRIHEFMPMSRQACAACHTAKAAGDSCTKCHRYHIQK